MDQVHGRHQCIRLRMLCMQPLSCLAELEVAAAQDALICAGLVAWTVSHYDYLHIVAPMSLPE